MPSVGRVEAARELMAAVKASALWTDPDDVWHPAALPGFSVGHFDFEVKTAGNSDFMTFSVLDSRERYTNDGWVNLAEQAIEVGCFSQSRERTSRMADVVFRALADYRGAPRSGGPVIQSCFFDESIDVYDEEASYFGLMMAFVVNVTGV